MINQELVAYTKKCLDQGIGKEEIRKTLVQAGWQMNEVDAVLGSFEGNQVKKFNIKLTLSLGLLFLILVGGGLYWWQSGAKKNADGTTNLPVVNVQNESTTLEKYIAANVEKYKLSKPDATEAELVDFSAKLKEGITSEVENLIAACKELPTLVNSSEPNGTQLPENFGLGPVLAVDNAQTEMYAQTGLYRTTDSGATWKSLSSQEDILAFLSQLEKISNDSVACSDISESVSMTSVGFEGEDVWSILPAHDKPNEIYAGVGGGRCLYKSVDSGAHWSKVHINTENMVPQNLSFENLVVDPENSDHLYAVGGMFTPPKDSGEWDINTFIESFDGGVNWQPVIIDGLQTIGLSFGSTGKVVYATTKFETWKKSGSGYNGVKTDYYLYQSEDNGKNWNKVYESLGADKMASQCSYSNIDVDRRNSDVVYVVCEHLYKSLDAGKTWNAILESDDSIKQYVPADLVVTDGLIYGVNPASGIELFLRSSDKGKTWEINNTGFHIYQIAVSQSDESMIFATDFDSNVYVSKNSGDSWSKINLPVELGTDDLISSISFHNASKSLFVGTSKGLYSIPIQ